MPNTVIAIKKSATPAAQPTVLANGELAINYADGKLFYKHANGTILPFNTQGGNAFGTINANGTLVVAGTSQDVVSLIAGNNITITGDAINDTITIELRNDLTIPGTAYLKAAGGDEGGELQLANAISNSVLSGNVVIDVYQNKIRFFEQLGTNRGAFINIASAAAGVGTDLLSSTSSNDTIARTSASAAYDKANAALANSTTTYVGTLTIVGNTTIGTTSSTMNVSSNVFFYQSLGIGTSSPRANLDVRGTFTVASANVLSQSLTDAATVNWDTSLGQVATLSLGGNRTFAAPTNLKIGTLILHVIQDATGGRTLTWNSIFKWPGGAAPVLTTAGNSRDVFSFITDGTNLYGTYIPDVK